MEKMVYDAARLKQQISGDRKQVKKLFGSLSAMKPAEVDALIHPLHHTYTEQVDCLECANCCKNLSPAIKDRDVDRIAKHLGLRPSIVVERYLEMDEEGDYVFRTSPCPFLDSDNYCSIYDARPKACREYPHTDRVRQQQLLEITRKNASTCPIVFQIVQDLKER